MLTCKVGEEIVNTIEFEDGQIRKWSNKGILKCPVCENKMIYKHGEIKIAHFAHEKDSECEDIYSEPESEEHLKGKRLIYEWLKTQEKIENLKLESWIPETKQRPDLYFEINSKRCVIEFQCSPIATEYIQRHRLYQLAGIIDIWVLGTNKYNIKIDGENISHSDRLKTIEEYNHTYLNVEIEKFILGDYNIMRQLKHCRLKLHDYYKYNFEDIFVDEELKQLSLLNNLLKPAKEESDKIYEEELKQKEMQLQVKKKRLDLMGFLNTRFKNTNENYKFDFIDSDGKYYLWKILFTSKYDILTYFIKEKSIDCCTQYESSVSKCFRGRRGGLGWTTNSYTAYRQVSKATFSYLTIDNIKGFILEETSKHLRKMKYPNYKEEL